MKVSSRKSLAGGAFGGGGGGKEDEPENDAPSTARPPSRSKRYSTAFDLKAASSPKSHEEKKQHQAIAEFYQDVVKRVQENKLTAKNAFGSRNIIDNLDVVLQLAKGSFHKASCAVSTAAEIYCLEVDDLSATTSLVQEMLFNSDKKRGELDAEDARANRKKAEGAGSNSTGFENCCTLETNLANIRSDQVEAELEIDAQFQKLLQGKDSGAQGMLLNMLGMYNGANLALDCTGVQAFFEDAQSSEDSFKTSVQIPRDLGSKAIHFVDCKVAPALSSLREELAKCGASTTKATSTSGSIVESLDTKMAFRSSAPPPPPAAVLNDSSSEGKSGTVQDYEYDDYMDADGGGDFYEDDSASGLVLAPEAAAATTSSSLSDSSFQGEDKTHPHHQLSSALPFIMRAFEEQAMGAESGKVEFFEAPDIQAAMQAERGGGPNKLWLGDVHWKAPRQQRNLQKTTMNEQDAERKLLARKKRNERLIDFFAVALDEKKLLSKPSSARVNLLPRSSLTKDKHVLPRNAHVTVADFKRLFLRPQAILQPLKVSEEGTLEEGESAIHPAFDAEDDDGGGYYDDDQGGGGGDDEFYECVSHSSPMKNLVAPAHHVERIRVAFATRAKKVDVKKLKYDLWETIDTLAVPQQDPVHPEEEPEVGTISLVGSIQALAPKEQNETITVPFYFICMLHLANEHGLELKGSESLDDITIFKPLAAAAS